MEIRTLRAFLILLLTLGSVAAWAKVAPHGLISTSGVLAAEADPEVLQAVKAFEKAGGTGGWVRAPQPFGDGALAWWYRVATVPQQASGRSPFFWLRVEPWRAIAAGIIEKGTPFFVGPVPLGYADAFALSNQFPLAQQALAAMGDVAHKDILVVRATSNIYEVEHEYQHWLDFEDESFQTKLGADLQRALGTVRVSQEEVQLLFRVVWEMRGHGAQERAIRREAAGTGPYVDRGGNIRTDDRKANFDFQVVFVVQAFSGAYWSPMSQLLSRIQKASAPVLKKLVATLKSYELEEPVRTLSFGSQFPAYFGASRP